MWAFQITVHRIRERISPPYLQVRVQQDGEDTNGQWDRSKDHELHLEANAGIVHWLANHVECVTGVHEAVDDAENKPFVLLNRR